MGQYISSIKLGGLFSVYGFITGDENGSFGECVCDSKYCIVRIGWWEFDDEVHGY